MPFKNLDDEIYRSVKDKFNNAEPPVQATVTVVNSDSVSITLDELEGSFDNVPILKSPVYTVITITSTDPSIRIRTDDVININVGDKVLIVFADGEPSNPIVVGKVYGVGDSINTPITNSTASLDTIGKEEATYPDVQDVCSDATCFVQLGYGDCWADAEWLYNSLSASNIECRIMGYNECPSGNDWYRHAWVQINTGSGWVDYPYSQYNSHHVGNGGGFTPFVLVAPDNAPADILATGY